MKITLADLRGLTADQIRTKIRDARLSFDEVSGLHSEARREVGTLASRAEGGSGGLTGADASKFDELADLTDRLKTVVEELKADEARHDRALAVVRSAARGESGDYRIERGSAGDYDRDVVREPGSVEDYKTRAGTNPWDLSGLRTYGRDGGDMAAELRGRALSAIEKMQGASDNVREAATMIIERFDDKGSSLARQALITSSPAYLRAWSKLAGGRQSTMTAEESRAVADADALQRAMSLTDNAGGYLVPFQLDPTVIITSAGSQNDIRQFAKKVVATGDKWHGVSSNAVSWSWDAEGAEVSDDSTTFDQPEIDIHKAAGFVPISIEAIEDAANATQTVAELLAFGKDDLEAQAFTTGNGTTQPEGIITGLDGTSAEMGPAVAETFSLADVYAVRGALPARHRKAGAWMANDLTYSKIRQFDTSGGGGFWEFLGEDRPDRLLGKPVGESEAMDASTNAAATQDNFILVFGNFGHGYVIADRVGMSIEFIPHLFGANRRPTGQRGWYAYYRTGAGVVDPGAFKMLNVATTA